MHPSTPGPFLALVLAKMLGHQFAYSAAPIRKVREVQFGILSPEEIVCFRPPFPVLLRLHILESVLRRESGTPGGYG